MSAPSVTAFFDEATFTVTYVAADPESAHAAVIDPVLDYDPASGRTSTTSADVVAAFVADNGLTVDWILETHVHADHLSAAPYLKKKLGGRIAIGRNVAAVQETFKGVFNIDDLATDGSQFDHRFTDGERFSIGDVEAYVMATPGHTPACITYVIGDAAFVGDTLFMPDYGTARADFPGGDARALFRSIRRLMELPDETRVFLCHDYKAPNREEYVWETTIGHQRTGNVHVHEGVTEDDFVSMREARDATLEMPRLILPAIQVNMRAGHLPRDRDGREMLKVPVNALG